MPSLLPAETSPPLTPLAKLLGETQSLYSLPAVALDVVRLTAEPKVDLRKLKERLETDPALTARILRTVNSSLFGLARQVTDLNQSLALLGLKPLKMLVLGFSLPPALTSNLSGDALRSYWRRTLVKAVACRLLAQRLRQADDEAFIAGLLQEVGVLVLLQKFGDRYARLRSQTLARSDALREAEQVAWGFDHLAVSAGLLEQWSFPAHLPPAIVAAHSRASVAAAGPAARPLAQLLLVAGAIADVIDRPAQDRFDEFLALGRDLLRLSVDDLQRLLQELYPQVQQLGAALRVDLGAEFEPVSVLAQAHAQLAEVSAAAAEDLLTQRSGAAALAEIRTLQNELRAALSQAAPAAATASLAAEASPAQPALEKASREPAQRTATATDALETDPGLRGRIAEALAGARQERAPLCLALCEVDGGRDLLLQLGARRGIEQLQRLVSDVEAWLGPEVDCLTIGDARLAVLLPNHSRNEAVSRLRALLAHVRAAFEAAACDSSRGVTLSAGVAAIALPPKNFPPGELLAAARRCLSAAQLSGGDTVKSIEL